MKGKQHPANDVTINPSGNESISDLVGRLTLDRRGFVKQSVGSAAALTIGSALPLASALAAPIPPNNGFGGIGFESIPPRIAPIAPNDGVAVPPGYKAEVLFAWGDPVMPGGPAFDGTANATAADQEKQFGMHTDGMHFFPFVTRNGLSNDRGILCVNNEYTHEEILHPDGLVGAGYTIAKTRKSQAAHGVTIAEVRRVAGKWGIVPNSPYGRRITANTPMMITGPVAGHLLLRSKQYTVTPAGSIPTGSMNDGYTALGTVNNCAHGYTPWGTYLTCEENWNGYFGATGAVASTGNPAWDAAVANDRTRYGLSATGFGYRWHTTDPRWDATANPLEPYHFGWVVEIDPSDPGSVPKKRTALGRFKHESAQVAISGDEAGTQNRIAFYMGDDERNEYIYKFVCTGTWNPRNRAANTDLLDSGILYVARFSDTPVPGKPGTYRGQWLALAPDTTSVIPNPGVPGTFYKLRELPQFAGANDAEVQALILLKTRQAADAVGATMMDRPEWTAVRTYGAPGASLTDRGYFDQYGYGPDRPLEIYCTLTNNNRRGTSPVSSNNPAGTTAAGSARPPVDVANPRNDNRYGHIIRWREDGNYVTAVGFEWDIFVLAGDSLRSAPNLTGNIVDIPDGSADYGAPDGLWFDQFGRLWIQTDQAGDALGDWTNIGANTMSCADPNSGETRRFLTSPRNCEVTGVVNTPDGKTMFVGIQHPGEDSLAADPEQFSRFPHGQFATNAVGQPLPAGRPRSAVLVITRDDGGIIGA